MHIYEIRLSRTAAKQLNNMESDIVSVLLIAIKKLASNPRPSGCKKLRGREGYRIRKGNYRIIYDIYDKVLTVEIIAIGHRKNIYD